MTKPATHRTGRTSHESGKSTSAHWLTLATTPAYCDVAAMTSDSDTLESRKRVLHPLHQPTW